MNIDISEKEKNYQLLIKQAQALLAGECDYIANAANLSALIYHHCPQVNWAGFYFVRNGELVLGPFQGQVACVRIAMGRGVCGTAAISGEVQCIADVHQFEGHIACDATTNSEIVIPIARLGSVVAVLDIDSAKHNRFDALDQQYLSKLAQLYCQFSDLSEL